MVQLAIKNLSKLAPFTGGPWNLPHKVHLYLIYIYFSKCHLPNLFAPKSFLISWQMANSQTSFLTRATQNQKNLGTKTISQYTNLSNSCVCVCVCVCVCEREREWEWHNMAFILLFTSKFTVLIFVYLWIGHNFKNTEHIIQQHVFEGLV